MTEITKPRGKAIIVIIEYDSGDKISISKNANIWVDEIGALLTEKDIMGKHPDKCWEDFGVEIELIPNKDYVALNTDEVKEKYRLN